MILHFDLDLERLVSGPTGRSGAISRLSAMERAKVPLNLYFWRGRTPAAVTGTPVITLGIKAALSDVSFLAVADDTDWTSTAGGTIWTATLDLATAEMIAAIGDMETLRALAQLSIALDDGNIPKSQPVETTIFGAVVQGDEGTPTAVTTPDDYVAARAVLYDRSQNLTEAQKRAAALNAGAVQAITNAGLILADKTFVAADFGASYTSTGSHMLTLPAVTTALHGSRFSVALSTGTDTLAGASVTDESGATITSISAEDGVVTFEATAAGWNADKPVVTNAKVVAAITAGPAASRLAMGVHSTTEAPSNAQLDISLELAIHPAVRAYSSRALLTNRNGIIRLDAFKKGVDALGLTLNEAVFFGEGLNNQAAPISFVRMDAGTAGAGTFTAETHGLVGTADPGNTIPGYWRFPISGLTDFTVCHFYSGNNVANAYRQFVGLSDSSLATTGSYLRIMTADVSGNATAVAFKSGEVSAAYALHSGYTTELVRMLASKWEDGVGVSSSHNGAAFGSQAAYAQTISASLEWLGVGGHNGTHIGSLVFDGLLTDTQIAEVRKLALRTIASSNIYAVLEGDSIMEGANEWFEMALRSDTWAGAVTGLANIAIGGETAKQVYDQAVAGSFNTYKPTAANPRTWLFLQAGHNDLALHASSGDYAPTKVLEHLTETCRIAKAAGFEKTVVTTVLKGSGISGNGRLADVDTINAALLAGTAAGSQYIDEVVDMESAISDAAGGGTYWTNTTYFSDGVHPNDTGRAVMAAALNTAILPTRAME